MATYHPQAARFLASVATCMPQISGEQMQAWIGNPSGLQKALREALCPGKILSRIATAKALGTKRLVASKCLKTANIGWPGDNFNRLFHDKVEENVGDANLVASRLKKNSLDASILAELGEKAETTLAHMFWLLTAQSKGEDGILLTNGCANIFYIRGTDNNLWTVSTYWHSGGHFWSVEARSVEDPHKWNAGNRVFSRDS